jgi:hypothetical protein
MVGLRLRFRLRSVENSRIGCCVEIIVEAGGPEL